MDPTIILSDLSLFGGAALFIVGALVLRWLGTRVRGTNTGFVFAFVMCTAAAYATAMAVEIGSLLIVGVSAFQSWSLGVWTVLGITGFVVAAAAAPSGWLAMIPCCIMGALMMLQGPMTADPLVNFPLGQRGFNQYSLLMHNATFAAGMVMLFTSVLAGLAVGAGHQTPAQEPAPG